MAQVKGSYNETPNLQVYCPACDWFGRLCDTIFVPDSAAECPQCGTKVEELNPVSAQTTGKDKTQQTSK